MAAEAPAAVDQRRVAADLLTHFGGKQLQGRRFHGGARARFRQLGDMIKHVPRDADIRIHLRDGEGHPLIGSDRPVVSAAPAGIFRRFLQRILRDADGHRGKTQPPAVERHLQRPVAFVFFPDQGIGRKVAVTEADGAGGRVVQADHLFTPAVVHAFRGSVHIKQTHAAAAAVQLRFGAHNIAVGNPGVRDPALGAVQNPSVRPAGGDGIYAQRIGAAPLLAECERKQFFANDGGPEPFAFLLLAGHILERVAALQHVRAQDKAQRGHSPRQLFHKDHAFKGAAAGAAQLFWKRQPAITQLTDAPDKIRRVFPRRVKL